MKKTLALILALAMVLALAACGKPVDNGTKTPADGGTTTTTPSDNGGGTTTPPADSGADGGEPATPPADTTPEPVEVSSFSEAPFITNLGTYGSVEDRLPVKDDVMVENDSYLEIGTYGGELKRTASTGNWNAGKPIEEGLFRFRADGTIEPNVAKSWEINEDSTVYTVHLREGMKWSDGEPFTAEDCVWFYNQICLNNLDSKGVRACHKDANGDPAVVEKVDDYTFTVTFGTPKYDFVEACEVDIKWHWAPKHTFETLVNYMLEAKNAADDAARAEADAKAIAEAKSICGVEFADSNAVGKELFYYFWNYPGIPTVNSYVLSTEAGKNSINGDYYEYVRNPYFWKVDAAGNQLPYIDKITYTAIQNVDQGLMLLLDGSEDYQTIAIDAISTIQESANVPISIYEWGSDTWGSAAHQLHFNLAIGDEHLNALFNNPDFRQAVSICVDREQFAAIVSDGWLGPGQAAPQKGAMGYSEEWSQQWTEYDVAKAKTLLEGCGLVMGSDGYYDFSDGTDFVLNIVAMADNGSADTYALLKPYYDAAGIKTTFRDYDRSNIDTMTTANEVQCMLYPATPIGDISIILKPNSMVPGAATNVVWYGTMTKDTATGDLLELIKLKEQLDVTADTEERNAIAEQMLALHQKNQWTIGYVEAAPTIHAVNSRIKNFPAEGVFSDIYRDMGLAHCWCWYIAE